MYRGPNNTTIGPGNSQWEKQTTEQAREALNGQQFRTSLNAGDIVALRDKNFATPGRRLDRPADILKTAWEMLKGWEFTSVLEALRKAQEMVSEYDTRVGEGAADAIFNTARKADLDFADEHALAAVITKLGQQGFIPQSELSKQQERQFANEAQENLTKAALISDITKGKSTYTVWDWEAKDGRLKKLDAAPLQSKTVEELNAILAEVTECRRKHGLTREEQRAELRQSQEAKGYRTYRPGVDRDSLDLDAQKQPEGSIPIRTDRSAGVNVTSDLINPASGVRYTKAEVWQLARHNVPVFRVLMQKNCELLNQILAGKA